jgi:hypothetical protein
MRFIIPLFAALLLVVSACSQESTPPQETAKPAIREPSPAPPAAPVAEEKNPLAEPVKPLVSEVQEKVEQVVTEVEKEVAQKVESVKEQTAAITEDVKTATAGTVEKIQHGAASALSGLKSETARGDEQSALPAVTSPPTVVYDASMGKVSFNHAGHAERSECSSCHPTDPPQKIAIDKLKAHTLCTGCHKASDGSAPTTCSGCHKK